MEPFRPVGQAVKTPPFHGGNMGSNPVRVIFYIRFRSVAVITPACHAGDRGFNSRRNRHFFVAIVAKWLTHRIVVPTHVGSIPINRPMAN